MKEIGMKKIIIIFVMIFLLAGGGQLFALNVPSEAPVPEHSDVPVHSGGLSDTETILFAVIIVLLIVMVV